MNKIFVLLALYSCSLKNKHNLLVFNNHIDSMKVNIKINNKNIFESIVPPITITERAQLETKISINDFDTLDVFLNNFKLSKRLIIPKEHNTFVVIIDDKIDTFNQKEKKYMKKTILLLNSYIK